MRGEMDKVYCIHKGIVLKYNIEPIKITTINQFDIYEY